MYFGENQKICHPIYLMGGICTFNRTFSSSNSSKKGQPLEGIRIIDLTRILAGPYCTMVLADLGAEVIKVENPNGGDETRRWGPPFAKGGESAYFLSVNRNKKSVAINFKDTRGLRLLKLLIKDADVLVENYIPGKLESMGLGYDELKKDNPALIYASLSGHGSTGPLKSKPGYDVMASAMGGLMGITGNDEPCKVGVAITDMTAGLFLHGAIMAALLERYRTGQGQKN